jgi:hypothetical protein
LPIQLPAKFELAINAKAAKELGRRCVKSLMRCGFSMEYLNERLPNSTNSRLSGRSILNLIGRGGDDDGKAETRTGATVSAAALHALGSAGEASALIASEAHRQETAGVGAVLCVVTASAFGGVEHADHQLGID